MGWPISYDHRRFPSPSRSMYSRPSSEPTTILSPQIAGELFDESSVQRAADAIAEEFTPIDDARASADYRRRVARNLLRRCLLEYRDPDAMTEVMDVH